MILIIILMTLNTSTNINVTNSNNDILLLLVMILIIILMARATVHAIHRVPRPRFDARHAVRSVIKISEENSPDDLRKSKATLAASLALSPVIVIGIVCISDIMYITLFTNCTSACICHALYTLVCL